MKLSAGEFVESLKKDLGYDEQPGNRNKFAAVAGHANGQSWCATYVSAKLIEAEVLPKGHSVLVPSSRTMHATAKQKGWAVKASDLKPGDIVHLIRGPVKAWKGHVGVVVKVLRDASGKVTEIWTIEGNATPAGHANVGGSVGLHKRKPSFWGLGAWRPPYAATPTQARPVKATPTPAPAKPAVTLEAAWLALGQLGKQVDELKGRIVTLENGQR
jgi:hypothetical protein